MAKLYGYVGPDDIADKCLGCPQGRRIVSQADLVDWIRAAGQAADRSCHITVTFVVDGEGFLRVADRHSEHLACAAGGHVRSAGEITFELVEGSAKAIAVTNQSTGYCPEPESWPEVAAALDRIPIPHPDRFAVEMVFRRCPACGQRNIVKDRWFYCGVCDAELPQHWNFG